MGGEKGKGKEESKKENEKRKRKGTNRKKEKERQERRAKYGAESFGAESTGCQACDAYPVRPENMNYYRQRGYGFVAVCDDCMNSHHKQIPEVAQGYVVKKIKDGPSLFYSGEVEFLQNRLNEIFQKLFKAIKENGPRC